jgi:integrase
VVEVRYEAGRFGSGYKDRPKSDASIRPVPMAEPVATAVARRLDGCGPSELVLCGPGGSNGIPRGARSRLSTGNYRRVYRLAAARAELPDLDLHGPHDLRHTLAAWLEDGGIPARVIDELMGHQAGRRGEREGSMIGTR